MRLRALVLLLATLVSAGACAAPIAASDAHVARMGRAQLASDGSVRFSYPGVSFYLNFDGTRLSAVTQAASKDSYLDVLIDGVPRKLRLEIGRQNTLLADGLKSGPHTAEIVNRSESWQARTALLSFDTDGKWRAAPALPDRKLMVLGDSITCGASMDRTTGEKNGAAWADPRESYGMLLARRLNAQVQLVCYGGRGLIRMYDGKTNDLNLVDYYGMALPTRPDTVAWNQRDYRPDAIIVAIGTNDMAIGIPDREEYVKAYVSLVRTLLRDHPQAQIMLTESSMLKGEKRDALRSYIADTVRTVGDERVRAIASTPYPGDSADPHPTREQHVKMTDDLLPQVRAVMRW